MSSRLVTWLSRLRADIVFIAVDGVAVVCAYLTAMVFRFDGAVPPDYWDRFGRFIPIAIVAHLMLQRLLGLYGSVWEYASVSEARRLLVAGLLATALLLATSPLDSPRVPASVVIVGGGLTIAALGILRFRSRLFAFRRSPVSPDGLRVAVVGAGDAGSGIVRELLRNGAAGLHPVAIVDDDPRKVGRSLMGVPVHGPTADLARIVNGVRAQQVLFAIPTAGPDLVAAAAAAAEEAGVPLRMLPPASDRLHGEPSVNDVRDLNIEDLLGRAQVETDLEQVSNLLCGRRVLITGAGGSIGSEIARQVAQFEPGELVLLDHDETHLHDAAASIALPVTQLLCDIRDPDGIDDAFDRYGPEVVFHAAAHKHVPLLESHPGEAVCTNVLGTANVVSAAERLGVGHFVFISTDKAVRPSCVMGASKWFGEQLVLGAARDHPWCAVRFGNVLGSRGSVIPTFTRQIAAGGPVTVTDPRMNRFFMSVHEAVQLVLQAAVLADGGEVFELEMGEPVNILALAERMIRLTGKAVGTEIPIRFTGVRPGEKLDEELHGPSEQTEPTAHPSIVRLLTARMPPSALAEGIQELHELAQLRINHELAARLLGTATAWQDCTASVLDLRDSEHTSSWTPSAT